MAGPDPIGYGAPVPGAINQFSILIPTTTPPGYYTLAAAGLTTQGQSLDSPQITIGVQRPDAPIRLSVQPSPLELNVGEKGYLNVLGTYSDGSNFFLSHAPGTTYLSNDPSIATVDYQGIITAVSPGSTTIVVNGSAIVSVKVDPPMTIAPLKKALYAGQSQQFTPRSADRSIPPVSWSTNPPDAGSVSATGVYTAPSQITLQQPVLLTATSLADNTVSATATITLLPPVALSVAPSSVNLSQSQTAQFYASVSNAVNSRVKWSLNPVGVGRISPLGLYTAPATIGSPQTVALTATSTVDRVTGATATILLSSSGAATVTVGANSSALYSTANQVLSLSATVTSAGSSVNTGTVTFTVMQGGTTIGAATTSGTLANGVANASFTLPGGTAAGSYIIQAVYNAGVGYLTSTDSTHTLTVTSVTVAAPTFSPAGGTYSAGQMVTISTTTPGASIRYTTNGSAPSETAGTLYAGAITVTSSTTINAIAYESGMTDSAVVTAAYTITQPTTTAAANASATQSASSQVVVLSATVTSSGGAVGTGTVTFTVMQGATIIGSPVTSGTVTNGAASANYTLPGGTAAGAYTIVAVYNAGAGFVMSSDSTHMLTVFTGAAPGSGTTCNGSYNGTFNGNVTVSAGQNCVFIGGVVTGNVQQTGGNLVLTQSQVGGDVQMNGGGTFTIGPGAAIKGNLQIQNLPSGAGQNQVCGSLVNGDLQFQNNGTAIEIGSISLSCAGNTVGGNLTVQNNPAATIVDGNKVTGNLQDQNNTAPTQVFNNAVKQNLQCQNNSSITGGGNTAGQKQGQCAAF